MKKLVLSTICGLVCLTLVGCSSSSQSKAITDLSSQLERMQNTVSSISTSEVYDVTPMSYNYLSSSNNSDVAGRTSTLMQNSQNALATHENLRNQINASCATLKATLGQKYNLTKNQKNAIKTLTSALSKYNTEISNKSAGIKNATQIIKKYKNYDNINADQLNVGYTALNNEMQERIALFSNVLSTIDQVESVLNSARQEDTNSQTNPQTNGTAKNIDTYRPSGTTTEPQTVEYQNQMPANQNVNYGYDQNYNYAGTNNGYWNNGYWNNGYGYYRNNGLNPGRNTDTYLPRYRNIDTYRPIRPVPNQNLGTQNGNVLPASTDIQTLDNEAKVKEVSLQNENNSPSAENNFQGKNKQSQRAHNHAQQPINKDENNAHKIRRIPKSKRENEHIISKTQEVKKTEPSQKRVIKTM